MIPDAAGSATKEVITSTEAIDLSPCHMWMAVLIEKPVYFFILKKISF